MLEHNYEHFCFCSYVFDIESRFHCAHVRHHAVLATRRLLSAARPVSDVRLFVVLIWLPILQDRGCLGQMLFAFGFDMLSCRTATGRVADLLLRGGCALSGS